MAVLKFTLSEEGVYVLREVLACMGKFSDEVSWEAKKDRLILTALNSSKSAYASFSFATSRFFSRYQFEGTLENRDKFFCKLYNRSLLSLFRARSGDPTQEREKDTTIERCDVSIEDEPEKKSRFIVKIICRNGLTTKYHLPFEVSPPVHAKFVQDEAVHHWTISSRSLRQLMDHFGPGIEFLDINSEDDQMVKFTAFTEKVSQGDEVLKKPLHTSIAVEQDEFEEFEVMEDKLHIVISLKDFRAIIHHAAFLHVDLSARYSRPSRPMQLRYDGDAVQCEFLLMTIGERGAPGQKAKKPRGTPARGPRRQQLEAANRRTTSRALTEAPTEASNEAPPPEPNAVPKARQEPIPSLRPRTERGPSQRPRPPLFEDEESLFVPQNDDQWDPVNLDERNEGQEDTARLEWNTSAHPNPPSMNMRTASRANEEPRHTERGTPDDSASMTSQFEPTQRLSDARRKFSLFGE